MAIVVAEGTLLKVEIASTLTTVAQLVTMEYSGIEVVSVPTTGLATTTAKTFRPGALPDSGELTFNLFYDPADTVHANILTNTKAPAVRNWSVTYTDTGGAVDTFAGFVTSFAINGFEQESNVGATITIKITGATTLTP
jgi:hypothetical protein